MKRIVSKIILIAILCAVGLFALKEYREYRKQQTAQEWFEKQEEYIEDLTIYADNMDTVFALYATNSITAADFLTHISELQGELNLLSIQYVNETKEHPIKIGSQTYETQMGIRAIEDLVTTFQDILKMARENYASQSDVTYKYMAYAQNVQDDLADYLAAKLVVEDSDILDNIDLED